jgi:hypothetical protein
MLGYLLIIDNPASVKHRLSAEVKTTASLIIDNPASVKHRLSAEVKTTASLVSFDIMKFLTRNY